MKELISVIVKAIVDNPDEIKITETDSDHTAVIKLQVAKSDIGKVIGKKGRNIQSIRTILNAVAAKNHKRAVLEIQED